jgi:DNA invertase Pin-like site-specific DNA recombinase
MTVTTAAQNQKAAAMYEKSRDWLIANPVEKAIGGNMVFYCRTAAGGSDEIAGQIGGLYLYSQVMGYENVTAVYNDVNASGSTLNRPGMQKLLEAVRAGDIDIVIARDTTRLSRSADQFYELLGMFAKYGVTLVTVSGGAFAPSPPV